MSLSPLFSPLSFNLQVHLPSIYVQKVIQGPSYEKRIERVTLAQVTFLHFLVDQESSYRLPAGAARRRRPARLPGPGQAPRRQDQVQ